MQVYKSLIYASQVLLLSWLFLSAGSSAQTTRSLDLIDMQNELRTQGSKCGSKFYRPAQKLRWNKTLEEVAKKHSAYLNEKGQLIHYGRGGRSLGKRVTRLGYRWRAVGENLAFYDGDISKLVDLWLHSKAHCQNIFNATYSEMGAAEVNGYWTVIFGQPAK